MNYLNPNLKAVFKNSLHNLHSKGTFFSLVSLLFMFVLLSSSGASTFNGFSIFAFGASDVTVGTESALRAAVVGAPASVDVSYVIALDANIYLTGSLVIPADKNITLTNADGTVCQLIALNNVDTIVVNGALTLDGIVVTHNTGVAGRGVTVSSNGKLVMASGKISDNTISDWGGGVLVLSGGSFVMYNGVIANNTASWGGGVDNSGSFVMYNGVIANNTSDGRGGGVDSFGSFTMHDGIIANNTASTGGGVEIVWSGGFSLHDGIIANNTADTGGGVYNLDGFFTMSGGELSNNTAQDGGGVYTQGTFTMSGGVISGNYATSGGGVCISKGSLADSIFTMSGGELSNNRASGNGGGVWVTDDSSYLERVFINDGAVFKNNWASAAYNRNSAYDDSYNSHIGNNVEWSDPFTQGYNNYDISYVYGPPLTSYTVTVHDSYAVRTGAGNYLKDFSVTVNAGTRAGYIFSGWTVTENSLSLPNTAVASFTMPANGVVISAIWTPISNGEPVSVGDDTELKSAVNNAVGPTVIALTADISLTGSALNIPLGKDITLISDKSEGFWKLIGVNNQATISVDGKLTLDGIIVTHPRGAWEMGVWVKLGGTFILLDGEISGNSRAPGGGVYNWGTFEMYGGKISNNSGGGVMNDAGCFILSGGEISNNTADSAGGVQNYAGSFSMSGGEISNNYAWLSGGGVYDTGTFEMSGGRIFNNTVSSIGGGVANHNIFSISGGMIVNNTASIYGGGVSNRGYDAEFSMSNGMIANNTSSLGDGGGLYNEYGRMELSGGEISNNTASVNGGGIGVLEFEDLELIFIGNGVVFKNNRAAVAYDRASSHNNLYNSHVASGVTWTAPFTQGYNNYDISYTAGVQLTYSVAVSNSYATSSGVGNYRVGESVTVNAGSRDGYTFSSWTVVMGGVSLSNSVTVTFTMPERDVVLSANWTPVTSGGDGGSGSGGSGSGGDGGSSSKPAPSPSVPSEPTPSTPAPSPSEPEIIIEHPAIPFLAILVVVVVLVILVVALAGLLLSLRNTKGS